MSDENIVSLHGHAIQGGEKDPFEMAKAAMTEICSRRDPEDAGVIPKISGIVLIAVYEDGRMGSNSTFSVPATYFALNKVADDLLEIYRTGPEVLEEE